MSHATETTSWWQHQLTARPVWMQPLMLFCIYMAVIYMPWDIFVKPVAEDQEVWFGYMFTGWAAKATAPLHWIVYAAGAWGFWHMKPWMWPWAAVYCAQITIGMVVWILLYESKAPIYAVLFIGALFAGLTWVLHKARPAFALGSD